MTTLEELLFVACSAWNSTITAPAVGLGWCLCYKRKTLRIFQAAVPFCKGDSGEGCIAVSICSTYHTLSCKSRTPMTVTGGTSLARVKAALFDGWQHTVSLSTIDRVQAVSGPSALAGPLSQEHMKLAVDELELMASNSQRVSYAVWLSSCCNRSSLPLNLSSTNKFTP